MPASGYRQSVFWGNEETYGTTEAPINRDLGMVQSITPGEKNNLIKIRTLGGNRDYKSVVPGKFEISGSMEWYLQGGDFLRQAIGEDTGSTSGVVDSGPRQLGAGTGRYLHVLGSANSPIVDEYPSFTLQFTTDAGSNTLRRTYTGCRVNTFTISGNVDEPVKCSAEWMAMNVFATSADASSPTQYTQDPYVFYEGGVYLTSGVIDATKTAADLAPWKVSLCNSFEFSINNNCEAYWYISGTTDTTQSLRGPKFVIPKGRDTTLKLGLHFDSLDMYKRFLGNRDAESPSPNIEKFQIAIDFVRSGVVGSATSDADWIRIVVASASFDDMAINGSPEEIVNNDVTVFGRRFKIYVADDISSYSD